MFCLHQTSQVIDFLFFQFLTIEMINSLQPFGIHMDLFFNICYDFYFKCSAVRHENIQNMLKTHREAVAANVFIVQRYGHPDSDVGTPLYRRGGDGEVV